MHDCEPVDPSTALGLVSAHLEDHPDDDGAWAVAAEALIRLGQPEAALQAARRAHRFERMERTALLAWALAETGRVADARRWLDSLPEPVSAVAAERIAHARDALGEPARAAEAHAWAVRLAPDDAACALRLAERYERMGRTSSAAEVVSEVLDRRPSWAPARRVRVRLLARSGDLDQAAAEARVLLDGHELADDVESGLALELARIEDRRGRPTVAMAWARRGNGSALRAWLDQGGDPDVLSGQLDGLAEVPPPAGLPRPSTMPHRAAFVVGFPRSGTTLVQRMLAEHPDVATFDEAPLVDRALDTVLAGKSWAEAARAADDPEVADALRRRWWAGALPRLPRDAGSELLVVDKLPLNLLRLDLIVRMFPDAPIVLVQRDPRDAVLSAFLQDFRLNGAMARLTTLDGAARLYEQAMTIWERVSPDRGVVLRYEALLDDPEATWRPVIEALGLVWSPAVLAPRTSEVRLRTPSYAAVQAPLTRRSVGRWRPWAELMGDVLPVLEPWVDRLGY